MQDGRCKKLVRELFEGPIDIIGMFSRQSLAFRAMHVHAVRHAPLFFALIRLFCFSFVALSISCSLSLVFARARARSLSLSLLFFDLFLSLLFSLTHEPFFDTCFLSGDVHGEAGPLFQLLDVLGYDGVCMCMC